MSGDAKFTKSSRRSDSIQSREGILIWYDGRILDKFSVLFGRWSFSSFSPCELRRGGRSSSLSKSLLMSEFRYSVEFFRS